MINFQTKLVNVLFLICVYFQSFLIRTTHEKVSLSILNHDLQQLVSGSPAPGRYIWLSSRMKTAHLKNISDRQFFHRLPWANYGNYNPEITIRIISLSLSYISELILTWSVLNYRKILDSNVITKLFYSI